MAQEAFILTKEEYDNYLRSDEIIKALIEKNKEVQLKNEIKLFLNFNKDIGERSVKTTSNKADFAFYFLDTLVNELGVVRISDSTTLEEISKEAKFTLIKESDLEKLVSLKRVKQKNKLLNWVLNRLIKRYEKNQK